MSTQYSFEEIVLEPYEMRELKDFTKEPVLSCCHADILLEYGLVDAHVDIIGSDGNILYLRKRQPVPRILEAETTC